jgi:glycosyltransferase involved in cell wall biosynthesis
MKTSIVMATYNGEKFIKQQLDSITTQSVLPDELVVVDDGSKDNTRQLLSDFAEKFGNNFSINLVFRDNNLGYINNFIDGISRTSNELVFLCDQDDIWHVDKIKDTVQLFKENSDMIVLHTNTDIIDHNGNTLRKNVQDYHKRIEKIKLSKYVKKVNYPGMAMAFRKSVVYPELEWLLDKVVSLPTHDWIIGFIGAKSNGFYVSEEVYTYRRFTGQNVALSLEKRDSILDRVSGIEVYEGLFQFVFDYQKATQKNFLPIEKYQKTAKNRKKYLTAKSVMLWSKSFPLIRYYPKYGSYFRDILEIIKERRINDQKN